MKKWVLPMVLMGGAVLANAENRSMGGPDGVTEELNRAEVSEGTWTRRPTSLAEWKAELKEEYGVSLGLHAYWLYQQSDLQLQDLDQDAFGGVYRFQGNWEAFARDSGHPGRLEWRVEYRSGTDGMAPSDLSPSGSHNSGFGYSDSFDLDISVLNWTQLFNDKRAGLAIGRLAFDVYLDPYPFQTFSRAYLNRAFILNPTVGTTGIGALGAVAKGFVTDNFWFGGQIYDANAVSGEFDIDTIGENEWLSAVEFGWTPDFDNYKTNRVQLTLWHKDPREEAGTSEGFGAAFTACHPFSKDLLSFVRMGWSDGGAGVPAETSLSTGFEYTVRPDQKLAIGAGWSEPSDSEFDDEYVLETSYKWQVTPNMSITPDLQLLANPTKNPDRDLAVVGGVRCILTF